MQTTLFVVFQLAHFLLFFFSGKYLISWTDRSDHAVTNQATAVVQKDSGRLTRDEKLLLQIRFQLCRKAINLSASVTWREERRADDVTGGDSLKTGEVKHQKQKLILFLKEKNAHS